MRAYKSILALGLLWTILVYQALLKNLIQGSSLQASPVSQSILQESKGLTDGPGIKAYWNLTALLDSTAGAFNSTVADVDGDSIAEIIVSKNARCQFYCLKQDGTVLWQTPLLSSHTPGYYGGEVVDLTGDGTLEYVVTADKIWVLDAATGNLRFKIGGIGGEPDEAPWILGHVSSLQRYDIIIARSDGTNFVVSVYDGWGELLWRTSIENAIYGHTLTAKDVDHDGYDEVFVACSKKTVALDHNGQILWEAPLTSSKISFGAEFTDFHALPQLPADPPDGWWYHSDFVNVSKLYGGQEYYVIHDYGGGVLNPTTIQVLNALTGAVVGEFQDTGHIQWLATADLRPELPGEEIIYVTREKVVMRSSTLNLVWAQTLSGAHHMGLGDWDGDGRADIVVTTIFRGVSRYASLDSNFVVYNSAGKVIFNHLFYYPADQGRYAGAEMQAAANSLQDIDGDGKIDVPVCFSNHDVGKFGSSQDVYQYIMSYSTSDYSNLFLYFGNHDETLSHTQLVSNALQLEYDIPTNEYINNDRTVILFHLNEGEGNVAADNSAYKNTGYLSNTEWMDEGYFGSAVRFGKLGALMTIPFTDSLSFSRVMIEAWVKLDSLTADRYILEQPGAFGLNLTSDGQLHFYIWDLTALQGRTPQIQAPVKQAGEWMHVVAMYDGFWLRLILDGQEVAAESHVGEITASGSPLYIGNKASGDQPLLGMLDEIRISSEIQPLPFAETGYWTSNIIFPEETSTHYGQMTFEYALQEGKIAFDVLDKDGHSLIGYTDITTTTYSLVGLTGPLRIQVRLERGNDNTKSPLLTKVQVSRGKSVYLPVIIND